jgi:predicted ATPase/DNA-binding SARP family transcriptional activator
VEIRILGPIEVIAAGEKLSLGGARERALLAILAMAPGQTLSSDRLIDTLWGEELPANPQNALQAVVSRLRRSLEPDVILTRSPGYVLDIALDAVDASRFRRLVEEARLLADPGRRAQRLRAALELWRGPALADFALEEFAQQEISTLEELRLLAVEDRIEAELEAGAGAELVPELEELISKHPLRESLRAGHMLALYRAGRRAEALRAYTASRRVLGEELGIEPGPELRALEEAILMQDPGLRAVSEAQPVPMLPARLASFVGRADELREVADALTASRLVTLTGAGGAGKTSLAVETARGIQDRYPDGVWMVELAPLSHGERVPDALLAALQLELSPNLGDRRRDTDPLLAVNEYLRPRRALLIVDNCEHVLDAVAQAVQAVLLASPQVDVIATSRERLDIPGELLWRVPPLGLSNGAGMSDAVALFVERARAVNPGFEPSASDLEHVAGICRRLDGMPLAIELAAARVRSLPVADIAARLETGIGILSGGSRHGSARQQTLRATIDWSYELLGGLERRLFARLAVFHGSFSLDAAEAVAPQTTESHDVLVRLEKLLDSSMVTAARVGAAVRYRMLETLRVYASEKLEEEDEADTVMGLLLDHLLTTLATADDELRGPDQLIWLERLEADQDTIRRVLDWAGAHAPERGLRLAGHLGWFWFLKGAGPEAMQRLGASLAAAGAGADARARAQAHFFLSLHDPQPERALPGFAAARDAYLESGDQRGVANSLAMIAAWGSDPEQTRELAARAIEIATGAGYDWGVALIRFLQAGAAAVVNDIPESARLAEEAARLFAEVGDRWGQGYSLYTLGVARRAMGEYEAAVAALEEALTHARPMRLRREMAPVMCELASIATMRGDYERAEGMLAQAREYADEVPFAGSQGMVRNAQGRLARLQGDHEAAHRLHSEAVALYRDGERHGGLAYSYSCLGFNAEAAGDLDAARSHHLAALEHAEASDDVFAIALGLEGIGTTLVAAGEARRGVELIAAGLAAREKAGNPLPAGEWSEVDRACDAAGRQLDAAEFAAALESGRSLDVEEAVALARP